MTDRPIFFDHQKGRIEAENKRQQDLLNEIESFKVAFKAITNTPYGLIVFRFLCRYLSFKESSIVLTPEGQLDKEAMSHNEARREVWVELRKYLDVVTRNEIERDIE